MTAARPASPARDLALRALARALVPALVAGVLAAAGTGASAAPQAPTVRPATLTQPEAVPVALTYPEAVPVARREPEPAPEPALEPTEPPPADPTPIDPTPTEPLPVDPTPTNPPVPTNPPPVGPGPTNPTPGPRPSNPNPPGQPGPTRPPPPLPGPAQPGEPVRGVQVSTGDLRLDSGYWTARDTVAELAVTVRNTGRTTESVRLHYTLPQGVTDAGSRGCSPAGARSYHCGAWTAAPGARFSTRLRLRIDGDAWRRMPLSGAVRVTATSTGRAPMVDTEGFAVLFPDGPPVAGLTVSASEVAFDITGQPTWLDIRLGNTSRTAAAGRIETILPPGVTIPAPSAGCRVEADRVGCDLGTVGAGASRTVRLPVSADPAAQLAAPLAGAAIGTLTTRAGKSRQVRVSFRITAAVAAVIPPQAGTPAPTGSQGVLGVRPIAAVQGDAAGVITMARALVATSALLVVLTLAVAVLSLRRRLIGDEATAGR